MSSKSVSRVAGAFAPGAGVARAFALAASLAGCSSNPSPGLPAMSRPDREKGTYLARTLADREPRETAARTERPAAKPAAHFQTPFGGTLSIAPAVHSETSIAGRPLHYWVLGNGPENVLLLGGIHGDERSSSEVAYDLLAFAADHPELLAGKRLVVAPEVNPDGLAGRSRRNQRGVDLNRNFPSVNWSRKGGSAHSPGAFPSSEPETRFVLALLRRFPPERVIATHAAAACVNFDGPGEELARRMGRECGLPPKRSIGYPTPGSLGSMLGIDQEVPTITFELEDKDSTQGELAGYRRALVAALCWPQPPPAQFVDGASAPRGETAVARPTPPLRR